MSEDIKKHADGNDDCWLCDGRGEVETEDRDCKRATVPCPECMSREFADERAVLSASASDKKDADADADVLELIDRKAQAGLCQMSQAGARAFLEDIRVIVANAKGDK